MLHYGNLLDICRAAVSFYPYRASLKQRDSRSSGRMLGVHIV